MVEFFIADGFMLFLTITMLVSGLIVRMGTVIEKKQRLSKDALLIILFAALCIVLVAWAVNKPRLDREEAAREAARGPEPPYWETEACLSGQLRGAACLDVCRYYNDYDYCH